MKCPNCGNQNDDNVNQCTFCGQRLASKNYVEQEPEINTYQNMDKKEETFNQAQANPSFYVQPKSNSNSFAIASLSLSIASIVLSMFLSFFVIPLDLAAIILGIISLVKRKNASKAMAISGIVIGVLNAVFWIVIFCFSVYLITSGALQDMINSLDPQMQQYFYQILNESLFIHF